MAEGKSGRTIALVVSVVAALLLAGVGYLVAVAYGEESTAEGLGAALGTIVIALLIAALVRAVYVRFFASERKLLSWPWILAGAALFSLLTLAPRLDRIEDEQDDSARIADQLSEAGDLCESRYSDAFPKIGAGFEYETLPERTARQLAPALPAEVFAQVEAANLRGPGFGAAILAVPFGDIENFESDATSSFEETARAEGLEPRTTDVDGVDVTYVEITRPRRAVTAIAFGPCHFRNITAVSLDDVSRAVSAIASVER